METVEARRNVSIGHGSQWRVDVCQRCSRIFGWLTSQPPIDLCPYCGHSEERSSIVRLRVLAWGWALLLCVLAWGLLTNFMCWVMA